MRKFPEIGIPPNHPFYIGVPPNHPFIDGIFPEINHPFWGIPVTMETPMWANRGKSVEGELW